MEFYFCKVCGNIISFANKSGAPVVCCGQEMAQLVPNTTDAAVEKHVPAMHITRNIVMVTVGAVEHPMAEDHFIKWIAIETKEGEQRKALKPGTKPVACFALCEGDELVAAYAYCNLHGLWKK